MLLVIAAICLNSCSDECDPCGVDCPNPNADLLGLWISFEGYYNGVWFPEAVGFEFDFREGDTVIAGIDTLQWYATSDRIIMTDIDLLGVMVVEYFFEVDTLDMTGFVMGDTLRWRCLREEDMPIP
jgi:hypothetical protein